MKKLLLILTAALTLSAVVVEAYITPGNPPGPGYGPGYGPGRGPGRPGPVRPGPRPRPPVRPDPGPAPYPGNPYPDPGYGTISVPVYVDRYMVGQDRIDIGQFVNLYQYQGYRLVAVDFTANAQYNTALIDVLINGFQVAPTINLNPYPNNFRIFPNQATYIGYGADSIVIYGNGNLYIRNVFLQLSR
jgi:hypothetical protein